MADKSISAVKLILCIMVALMLIPIVTCGICTVGTTAVVSNIPRTPQESFPFECDKWFLECDVLIETQRRHIIEMKRAFRDIKPDVKRDEARHSLYITVLTLFTVNPENDKSKIINCKRIQYSNCLTAIIEEILHERFGPFVVPNVNDEMNVCRFIDEIDASNRAAKFSFYNDWFVWARYSKSRWEIVQERFDQKLPINMIGEVQKIDEENRIIYIGNSRLREGSASESQHLNEPD